MKNIIYSDRFLSELDEIFDYIYDKKQNFQDTKNYIENIKNDIKSIPFMPYKHRPSLKSNDKNIRDLVTCGYVVPFLILENDILILGVFRQNKWEL